MSESRFFGRDYFAAMSEHYPEQFHNGALEDRVLAEWMASPAFGVDPRRRFQPISERAFSMQQHPMLSSRAAQGGPEWHHRLSVSRSYRGLIHLKTPFDLVLYTSLLWELRPKTIIEFGALQGASALWLAGQLEALGGEGQVHSFEYLDKCIHPSAQHPRLHFHHADLRHLETLDRALFASLPHPWLVIDDAHVNLAELMPFVGEHLISGDYYVVEDILLVANAQAIQDMVAMCGKLDLVVDTKYTDAFGYNVTSSPNSWLRKV